jgi:uncharacterized damage-inducible protein DinB
MSATLMTSAPPSPKQQYLAALERESAVTLKVLRAYPAQHSEMRPHPTSRSARELAWVFVLELGAAMAAVQDTLKLPPDQPAPPATLAEIIAAYERTVQQMQELLRQTSDEVVAAPVKFFTGPRTLGDVPRIEILNLMLNDAIHHRGQLSVYLRMTGSRVPSIYGPSGDEPWG